ncbi:helix-turn-helix DNA-binding domain protein [Rhodococcus phage GuyFagieri]|nr:helix-turn-helix DNA-binding domain protein [Rhodococcus phage GuyFagieri]
MSKPTPDINADLETIPNDKIDLGTAAAIVGVSPQTLRRMEQRGKISATRTASGHRRFRTHDAIRLARSAPEEVYRSSQATRLTPDELAKAITADDAARLLGVSRPTLRRWEREGKIVAYPARQGKKTLYNRESIEALAEIGG